VRTYFDGAGLLITDEWVQAGDARFPLGAIRRAWTARPSRVNGHVVTRWTLVGLAALAILGVTLWPFVGDWVAAHWWLLAVGVPLFGALLFWQVGLDVLGHHVENRPFCLWIATDAGSTSLLRDNEVEVNKALRALNRALAAATAEIEPRSA
jgi:hypothetical protein